MILEIPGYEILRPIAEGGMASIYLAVQKSLGRHIALKLLKKFDNTDEARRFQNEGRIIASLNHRNIITIHDIGVYEDRHYISMEYLEGGDLEARIQSELSTEASLDLLEIMCSCLEFLHSNAIIHRDLKPANILFHKDGTPILTDFGVARQLAVDMRLTMEGSAVGSPYYLSPEQAECKPLDGRTDIYSLGIIFYELLTGVKPFQGNSHIETILSHLTDPLPIFPPKLEKYQDLLEQMIAKDPDERFPTAAEMHKYIRKLRQRGPRGGAALERFTAPGELTHTGILSNTQQLLRSLVKSLQLKIWKIMRVIIELIRQRSAAVGVALVITALFGFIIMQPSMQIEKNEIDMDSHAMTVSLKLSELDGHLSYGMNPQTEVTGTAMNGLVVAQSTPPMVKSKDDNLASTENKAANTFTSQRNATQNTTNAKLLLLAQHALNEYRLTTPEGDNAYHYYHTILIDDPDNNKALMGMKRIANIYAELAEQALYRLQYIKARTYIERGLAVVPDNARLLELERNRTFSGVSRQAYGKVKSLFH